MTSDQSGVSSTTELTWKQWAQMMLENRWFREQKLIDQFFMTLEAEYAKLNHREVKADLAPIYTKVEALFQGQNTWRNAYHIEQLMVALYDDVKLELELKRKLLETSNLRPEKQQYYTDAIAGDLTPDGKRVLLGELINDLQWFYENRHVQRSYEGTARLRSILVFMITFLLFFLPNWAHGFYDVLLTQWGGARAYFVFTALTSGALGAAFSMLISLRHRLRSSTLEEVKMLQRYSFVVSRVVIGMGAGIIFYYFLQSGILEGEFMPNRLSGLALVQEGQADPSFKDPEFQDLALLIVWCFLSGFSEQLVPNILSKAEEQARIRSTSPPENASGI
ncbi:hypothetical protein [Candidatus Entotheonella palauensis]|uniref:hypothetical protein n=1 Tax=Candidatus Entotheonella palauensis TaxID=93172 RepID=UPI000B7F936F|nr:hypothetical protein [Candidatus Entotheonella palauensis]